MDHEKELALVREVLNRDLKTASDRVLTLELENQKLRAALTEATETYRSLTRYSHVEDHIDYSDGPSSACPLCGERETTLAKWEALTKS